jgi:hypothetical protein
MEDDELARDLDRLLCELPPEKAGAGFTAAVLRRLDALAADEIPPAPEAPEAPENTSRGFAGRPPFGWLGRPAGAPRLAAAAVALGALVATLVSVVALPRQEGLRPAAPASPLAAGGAPRITATAPAPAEPAARLASAAGGGHGQAPDAMLDRLQARRLLSELRGEEAQLERELRRLHRGARPRVIYLGGDEQVDMVIDLNRVPEVRHAAGLPPNLM